MALEPMDVFAEVEADPEYESMVAFWVSAAAFRPLLVLAMLGDRWAAHRTRGPSLDLIALATPVVLWGGWPFFSDFGIIG